jgi:hypothetical protein
MLQPYRHNCNNYFQIRKPVVGGAGGQTGPGGGQIMGYSEGDSQTALVVEAGGLTNPSGGQTARGHSTFSTFQ